MRSFEMTGSATVTAPGDEVVNIAGLVGLVTKLRRLRISVSSSPIPAAQLIPMLLTVFLPAGYTTGTGGAGMSDFPADPTDTGFSGNAFTGNTVPAAGTAQLTIMDSAHVWDTIDFTIPDDGIIIPAGGGMSVTLSFTPLASMDLVVSAIVEQGGA